MAGHADGFSELEPEPTRLTVGPRNTFVVRIWSTGATDLLRGHVQHVGTRRRAYFASRQRLQGFIEESLQRSGDGQAWRS